MLAASPMKKLIFTMLLLSAAGSRAAVPADYRGRSFADEAHRGGAQEIPGRVQCALYDLGGEGVGYHDADAINHGAGELNLLPDHHRPAATAYFWEFRRGDGMDTSYTKDFADFNHPNKAVPEVNQLYIGWVDDGEWCNYTVNVRKAGAYRITALYSYERSPVSFEINGRPAAKFRLPEATEDWHHWTQAVIGTITFAEAGEQLLTFRFGKGGKGNNFAWFEFSPVDEAEK